MCCAPISANKRHRGIQGTGSLDFGRPVSSIDVVVFNELPQGYANDKHDNRTDGHKQFSMACHPSKKEHNRRDYGYSLYRSPN